MNTGKTHFKKGMIPFDYDKKNNDPKNLISLCRKCHRKTSDDRNNWIKHFQKL